MCNPLGIILSPLHATYFLLWDHRTLIFRLFCKGNLKTYDIANSSHQKRFCVILYVIISGCLVFSHRCVSYHIWSQSGCCGRRTNWYLIFSAYQFFFPRNDICHKNGYHQFLCAVRSWYIDWFENIFWCSVLIFSRLERPAVFWLAGNNDALLSYTTSAIVPLPKQCTTTVMERIPRLTYHGILRIW